MVLIQAALPAYNGSRFVAMVTSAPDFSCGKSFGTVALSSNVDIHLGTPQFAALPDRTKQRLYETLVAFARAT